MFFFFKQKTAYEISACLVGSEMCIRDSIGTPASGARIGKQTSASAKLHGLCPAVRGLDGNTLRGPHRKGNLKRVVIAVGEIADVRRAIQLWIGGEVILREATRRDVHQTVGK